MSLPESALIRQAIASVQNQAMRIGFEADYLFCGRIGEVINRKCPSDVTAHPTGMNLKCKATLYTPDIYNPIEYQNVSLAHIMLYGKTPSLKQLSKMKIPAAIFTVTTEKRMGWKREIAVPLNPEFEPWAIEVFEWIKKHGPDSFCFTRQQMHKEARRIFGSLTYSIKPYRRAKKVNGEYQYDEKERLIKEVIYEHSKPFANHGIRHLRDSELKNFYGLSWEERHAYGGWTLGTEERYGENTWRLYFYKLCKPLAVTQKVVIRR